MVLPRLVELARHDSILKLFGSLPDQDGQSVPNRQLVRDPALGITVVPELLQNDLLLENLRELQLFDPAVSVADSRLIPLRNLELVYNAQLHKAVHPNALWNQRSFRHL